MGAQTRIDGKDERPSIDRQRLAAVVDMVAPLVRELDQQVEARLRAPAGSNKQILAQMRIDELESDIAFYASRDFDPPLSGAALAAAARSVKTPHLKRTATINAEALDRAKTRLDAAGIELLAAQAGIEAAYVRVRNAWREIRSAEAEHALIADGLAVL